MRETEKIEKVVETEMIVEKVCDGPGCKHKEFYNPRKGIWNDYDDDHESTYVEASLIINGQYVKYDFDVCPTCFKDLIIPLFSGEGEEGRIKQIKELIIKRQKQTRQKLDDVKKELKEADSLTANAKLLRDQERLIGESGVYHALLVAIGNLK